MPANNPNNQNAQTVQGPDPTGNQGYPIAVVPATGADPFPVGPLPPGSSVIVTDIEDGAGDSIMEPATNSLRATIVNTVSIAEPVTVEGSKSNNAAAPAAENVGVLPAIANAIPPAYTEGRQVLLSADLGGRLRGRADGVYSLLNTSDTPLGGAGTYTGTYEYCGDYQGLEVTIISDVSSAAWGVSVEWSFDAATTSGQDNAEFNIDFTATGVFQVYRVRRKAPYYRIVYTNGAAAQGTFALRVCLTNAYLAGQYMNPTTWRGCTFRTLGNAAATQNLLTIEANADGDIIIIKTIDVIHVTTAVLTALDNCYVLGFATGPTGGTSLVPAGTFIRDRGNTAASVNFTARGATAADGGAATAITAVNLGTVRRAFCGRLHTAVGQTRHEITRLLDGKDQPIYLMSAGQSILVQVINPTAANNAATNHYVVMVELEVTRSNIGGPS